MLDRLAVAAARSILRPMRVPVLPVPRLLELPHEQVLIPAGDLLLSGWHIPPPNPPSASTTGIVLCHGHNACRNQVTSLLRPLHRAGYALLLFDHRGHGRTRGGMCTYGHHEHQDILRAVEWFQESGGVQEVGLFGISMGAASALLAAAATTSVRAVVADSAFARLEEIVARRFLLVPPSLRTTLAERVRRRAEEMSGADVTSVSPEAVAGELRRPLLLIHGASDLLIPVAHAHRLHTAAGTSSELWVVPHTHHAWARWTAFGAYQRRVTEFFRRYLPAGEGAPATGAS